MLELFRNRQTDGHGLSAYYDEVIEIGILKVRSGDVTDRYEQLIRPKYEIDGFITNLTGITNEMVADKPPIEDVKEMSSRFGKRHHRRS